LILYQRKTLSPMTNVGDPGPVPAALLGWSDDALADVSAAAPEAAEQLGYAGQGFFPVEVSDPAPPGPDLQYLHKIDFLRLFTSTERKTIMAAAKVNADIADYQYMLDNSTEISLTDPDILGGVPALEAAGLIGTGRAAQILANEAP